MSKTNLIASMQSSKLSSVQIGQKDKKKMKGNKNNRHWISVFQGCCFFVPEKGWFSLLSVLSDFRQCKFVDLAKLLVLDG